MIEVIKRKSQSLRKLAFPDVFVRPLWCYVRSVLKFDGLIIYRKFLSRSGGNIWTFLPSGRAAGIRNGSGVCAIWPNVLDIKLAPTAADCFYSRVTLISSLVKKNSKRRALTEEKVDDIGSELDLCTKILQTPGKTDRDTKFQVSRFNSISEKNYFKARI
jgi:hypothetical protein